MFEGHAWDALRHGFKNRTGDRTGKALGSWFTGPTGGSLGSIAGPVLKIYLPFLAF
jgi:hypothetical protein